MKETIYYLKQIFPLIYISKYKDEKGNKFVSVWRQWFGRVLWVKQFEIK